MNPIKAGFYKHYKGNIYTVIGTGQHTETNEDLVFYQSNSDKRLWARPLTMFQENIKTNSYKGPRFSYINNK